MATCYFACDEDAPGAQRFADSVVNGGVELWAKQCECPEPLYSALTSEVSEWMVEEYYVEDDDHGDAFRYFDSETINHDVTVENAIVKDGRFVGALYRSKANNSVAPVLIGTKSYSSRSEGLSDTHDLDIHSSARLVRKGDTV